jgi:hypothetical protein
MEPTSTSPNEDGGDMQESDPVSYDEDVPTPAEIAETMERIAVNRARRQREKAAEPSLEEFFVSWNDITPELVERFRQCLERVESERDLQVFLEANPMLLVQPLDGGHGRWVVPHKRLGGEHVTDFMIAEKSSIGFEWTAVELESPLARMFKKDGDPTAALTHAVRQIQDWRVWLGRNRSYAEAPRDKSGLGLVDVDGNVPGWIVIGRRADTPSSTNDRRRSLGQQLKIEIRSYDWLLDRAESQAEWASGREPR